MEILVKFSKKLLYEDVETIKRDVLVYMQKQSIAYCCRVSFCLKDDCTHTHTLDDTKHICAD